MSGRQLRAFRATVKVRGWVVDGAGGVRGQGAGGPVPAAPDHAVAADILDVARAAEMAGVAADELEREIGEIF